MTSQGFREFDDACGIAHALELIGERWALLVLRELMFGPRRFSDMKADLPGITSSVLTQRLAELESRGLVRKLVLPSPASVQAYEATPWGLQGEVVMLALGRWAVRSPWHNPTKSVNAVSVMLSLKGLFHPEKAEGLSSRIGFRLGNQTYVVSVRDCELDIERRAPEGCDAVITSTPAEFVAVIYGGAPLEMLKIDGDVAAVTRFLELFSLPPKNTDGTTAT